LFLFLLLLWRRTFELTNKSNQRKATRKQGNKETRKQGNKETTRTMASATIYGFDRPFAFDQLKLGTPVSKGKTSSTNSSYLMRLKWNDQPLYLQPPKCFAKQSILRSGKQFYCDLVFSIEDEEFLRWLEQLETQVVDLLYARRNDWFETELDRNEIENYLQPHGKSIDGGKKYVIRVALPSNLGKCDLKIYDHQETEVALDAVKEHTALYSILECKGIRCSLRSFQFEFEVKQMMLAAPETLFEQCMIHRRSDEPKPSTQHDPVKQEQVEERKQEKKQEHVEPTKQEQVEEPVEPTKQEQEQEQVPTKQEDFEERKREAHPFNEQPEAIMTLEDPEQNNDDHDDDSNIMVLKPRDDVYYKLYREAKRKAKEAKWIALTSYLEAQNIKSTYFGNSVVSDDDDDDDDDDLMTSK
jgi:hypothetical protein